MHQRNIQAIMQISESPKRDNNPYSNFPDEKLKNQSISALDYTQLESRPSQSHSSSPNRMGATYEMFKEIAHLRGPVQIDLMASNSNNKVETFISPYPNPIAI